MIPLALPRIVSDLVSLRRLPRVDIDMMHSRTVENDPFYAALTKKFYQESTARHRRYWVIPQFGTGLALCKLPEKYDTYFMDIEAAGRRNCKKAMRLGYEFRRIDHNAHLEEITQIRRSKEVRQGRMSDEFLQAPVGPVHNPPARCRYHDYPYFGVLREGVLRAYAACFICGEACLLEHIFGHGEFESDGIVPRLYCGIVEDLLTNHPEVRYLIYGSYLGASETMRRFKRKFLFLPHNVNWKLES